MTVKILDDKSKKEILVAFNCGTSKTLLAAKYGVHRRTIDRVIWEMNGEPDKSLRSNSSIAKAPKNDVDYTQTIVVCTPKQVMITLSDGTQHVAFRNKDHFTRIFTLAMEEKYEEMMKYVDLSNAVKEFTFGTDIKISNGVMYYRGAEIHNSISDRIVMASQDTTQNVERYVNFFRKLQKNPSFKAVQHTYDFLVHNDLDINEEGDIVAYKYISYREGQPVDSATCKVPNWKGWTVTMPRNMVEDDPNLTCSQGLHVASQDYAGTWEDVETPGVIKVAVSPENVVSVPTDYNNSKMRCCGYKVLTGNNHAVYDSATVSVGEWGEILSISYEE